MNIIKSNTHLLTESEIMSGRAVLQMQLPEFNAKLHKRYITYRNKEEKNELTAQDADDFIQTLLHYNALVSDRIINTTIGGMEAAVFTVAQHIEDPFTAPRGQSALVKGNAGVLLRHPITGATAIFYSGGLDGDDKGKRQLLVHGGGGDFVLNDDDKLLDDLKEQLAHDPKFLEFKKNGTRSVLAWYCH